MKGQGREQGFAGAFDNTRCYHTLVRVTTLILHRLILRFIIELVIKRAVYNIQLLERYFKDNMICQTAV